MNNNKKNYIIIFVIFVILYYFLFYNTNIENFKIKSNNVNYIDKCDLSKINISYNDCKHLLDKKSKYQKIDVYKHPKIGNILVIDDDLQITENDEKNYHEMITHVPLNYFPDAKNVLIIGGGDGGTLTEVLKHNNLKNIINVEIDQEVINASKKFFPNIGKSFDDPRATVYIEDGNEWVTNNSLNKEMNKFFDVIILDITDFGASETIITKEFFINIKKMMKPNSALVLNYESLGWYESDLKSFKQDMNTFFKNAFIYQIYQPTYHSGHYSFAFLSDTINPMNHIINWKKFDDKQIKTNYYNKEVHNSSFSLPNKIINFSNNKKKERLGLLVSFDIVCNDNFRLNNLKNINNFFNTVLKTFNLSEVNRIHHQFNPVGITMISLLKESHLSIHTWPEKNKACIDIFTCGKFRYDTDKIKMETIIKKFFNTTKIRIRQIDREI